MITKMYDGYQDIPDIGNAILSIPALPPKSEDNYTMYVYNIHYRDITHIKGIVSNTLLEYGFKCVENKEKEVEYQRDCHTISIMFYEGMLCVFIYTYEDINCVPSSVDLSDLNHLSGSEFENLCTKLLSNLGFRVETTRTSRDGGIDIIAYSDQLLYSGKYIVQCKWYTGTVGEPILRDLYGVVMSCHYIDVL